jgi:hypothetical protein
VSGIEDGVPPDFADRAFRLAVNQTEVITAGAPYFKCYVIRVTDRQAASADEFAEYGTWWRPAYLMQKQRRIVRQWLDGLLAASPPVTEASS